MNANAKTQNEEMLRMGELARASGVSAATIKHYLREGLLPEPMKTSRNMAYYPADFVDRIRMIKQLLDEPREITPDVHIFTRSKLPWVTLPETVPAFDVYYDTEKLWPADSLERLRVLKAARSKT